MKPVEQPVSVNGLTLNIGIGTTDAPPMVLLHGIGARWQVFGPLLPALARDWRLYAVDLRGHGKSARAPGRYRIADFAADVTTLLDEQVDGPAVLYGHSLGGWVALQAAALLPGAVRAAVVADTAIYPADIDSDAAMSYLADLPIALRSLATSLRQVDPDVLAGFRAGHMTDGYDPALLLPRVTCPVLLLQGDPAEGGLMTDSDVSRALTLLPRGRHALLRGLGHGLHVEDAGAVSDALRPFLDSI